MITTYKIEFWNPYRNRYELAWSGHNLERAEIMFNKPYYRIKTRRLIAIHEEILYQEKADKS